jgi:hypothetical protein
MLKQWWADEISAKASLTAPSILEGNPVPLSNLSSMLQPWRKAILLPPF